MMMHMTATASRTAESEYIHFDFIGLILGEIQFIERGSCGMATSRNKMRDQTDRLISNNASAAKEISN
jgi:hypothetical protein